MPVQWPTTPRVQLHATLEFTAQLPARLPVQLPVQLLLRVESLQKAGTKGKRW
jgi:hypothetical protein